MKKIIQIIPTFGMGGAEIMCENLINELRKSDLEIIAISLYDKRTPITERLEKNGVDIRYLGKNKGLDLSMVPKLKKIFSREKPDIVHSHLNAMQYVVPAASMAGVKKRVHTVHSIANKELGKLAKVAAKLFYKRFNVVPVALSETIKQSVIDLYKLPVDRVPVVFNGTDMSKCLQKIDYSFREVFTIVHVGRFAPEKNHLMLLRSFKAFHDKYPKTNLKLIGDGEKRSEIEAYIIENGLTKCVELLGVQSSVFGFLNQADIFTLPSIYEGIPLTLTEAMGTGLPIVATNVGGIPDMLVNEESALLISVDELELANAFERLYLDETLRKRLGNNAKVASLAFSAEEMAKKYIEVYNQC